ncbi:MAG: histidine ammonia-lyase [Gemmatimonadaceae bacterium]|jgi:histidine ammonia-lyase
MTQPNPLALDGNSLTLADVRDVAVNRRPVMLSDAARARMLATRAVVADIVERNDVVYGVTTGFGKLSDIGIPPDKLAQLQVNLVRSHVAGVGPELAEPEARGMMLLRANVMAKGFSGARPDLPDLVCAMLNADLWPVVPEQGSVGASGDLAPLAALAVTLIGEGMLHTPDGRLLPALEALKFAKLHPVTLAPKEGLTLINGTQAHTAVAALAVAEARALWEAAHVAGAMSLEALKGTPTAFDVRIHDARGQEGQSVSAALLRTLLDNSPLRESHRDGDPRVQDAYALRCMPQVHGPVLDAIQFAEGLIGRELNAATDNPLVFANGELLSGGNFHGQAVAMALDVLAIAMTNLATISERRTDRLVHPDLNEGLPPFLSAAAGLNSGFMMAQVAAAALASECKVLSHPASVDTIPTDGSKEDVVPMAMGAAWKLRRIIGNVRHVIAIELMCAAQGLDCRRPLRSSPAIERAHEAVRRVVEPLGDDRMLTPDIQAIAAALARREFAVAAGASQ